MSNTRCLRDPLGSVDVDVARELHLARMALGLVVNRRVVGIRHFAWNPAPESAANSRGIPASSAISSGNLQEEGVDLRAAIA